MSRHYFKELRLQQFRGLIAVVETGSFSRAAQYLQLTRASVWQQVRALEKEFDCTLVEPAGKLIRITADGARLASMAAPLVESFDSIKEAFCSEAKVAVLSIATTPSCLAYELRNAVERVRLLFPDAKLTFHDRNSPAALELLEKGEVDIAVAARFEEWPQRSALDFLPFREHPFCLIAPEGHPLLKMKEPALADLVQYPVLLPGIGANCRPRLERLLREAGVWESLQIALECSFPASLHEYVEAGLGIAVSPLPLAVLAAGSAKTRPGKRTRLRNLSSLLGYEPLFYVRRKGWVETPIASAFRTAVLNDSCK
ncbi:MAG: LysR family transcriptional regulator [Verrucomicrobiota bacterium]|jgi:DNA-binding transcriptional LysR family regulator